MLTLIWQKLDWSLLRFEIMHQKYQHLDLQTLVDLLAEETQKYTKAFISGKPEEVKQQRIIIDFLVEEIKNRKQRTLSDGVDH
ncbi:hypothetical protein A3860_08800 [Niastella vici]|uniref:Uncharacterized protein n=1 Tax=Niastella vici TaxID=1703345 RepID=A0A1V9FH62_9BACT|nr:hypothetical protein [Niastella vici]OQP57719.1 hypothetical protein A3860_08800 [Niastella vici]